MKMIRYDGSTTNFVDHAQLKLLESLHYRLRGLIRALRVRTRHDPTIGDVERVPYPQRSGI